MARGQRKTKLVTTIVVLGLTLLIISALAVWRGASQSSPADNASETSGSDEQEPAGDTPAPDDTPETPVTDTSAVTDPGTEVDPATAATIDVEPLGITVSYDKDLPGFEFEVLRTEEGTRYAEFTDTDLIGNKCTGDKGLFATIIKNPASDEDKTTISKTTTIGADTYGLSLAGENCTGNLKLLRTYQTGFADYFGLLKALE